MSKPIAILISDVHYSLNNLELADKAFRLAIDKAAELHVPLIDCGDITNDKAILRGEIVNRLIETMQYADDMKVKVTLLVGNHSLINERGEAHVLNFLKPYADIIAYPCGVHLVDQMVLMIPYQSDSSKIKTTIDSFNSYAVDMGREPIKLAIMHQGFLGAAMGDYIQDKSSISPDVVKDFTVISGHYHRHQTIGTVTYIGSPFTHTFGEANDGPKGFLILNADGTFTREILKLRKHVKLELTCTELLHDMTIINFIGPPTSSINSEDLLWLKVSGPQSELLKLDKKWVGERLLGHSNYKLDLIPTDTGQITTPVVNLLPIEVFNNLIEGMAETDKQKAYLKELVNEVT